MEHGASATSRRRGARSLIAGLIVALSVTLGFSTAPADAIVPVLPPLEVGTSLAAPAVEVLGTACIASVACGVTVGILGVAGAASLYATKDTWLPVVKSLIGGLFDHSSSQPTCTVGVESVSGWPLGAGGSLVVTVGTQYSSCVSPTLALQAGVSQVTCYNPTTGVVSTGNSVTALASPVGAGPATVSISNTSLCSSSSYAVKVTITGETNNGSAGQTRQLVASVPSNVVSQTTTVTCARPDNSTFTDTKTITGAGAAVVVPSCQAMVPGSIPVSVKFTGGWPGSEQQLGSTLTLPSPATIKTNYANCFDSSGALITGSGACLVRVWINGTPCTVGAGHCPGWQTAAQDYGDTVECRWGNYVVAMSDCQEYLPRAYQATTGTQTLTTTDPQGRPVDPSDPAADPSTQTGTNDATAPKPDASNSGSCWGSGWSWNPVSWVVRPVECAMAYLFIPTTTLTGIAAPGLSAWAALIPGMPSGSCAPWSLNITTPNKGSPDTTAVTMPDTCSGSLAGIASVSYATTALFATVGAVMFVIRQLGNET